ncbi:Ras-related protein RABA1d-like [Oopsacas minuta]|uniref:Ras-related protein RABA1d-like n=1 Tax=Oopsacas minuta TaxID=111878 RepID=A0AAV7KID8_9METZ|nr:Ras-related protein RABA1d-like [Oopsacas minuta]
MASAIKYYNVLVLGSFAVGKTSIESWLANDRDRNKRPDVNLFNRDYYDVRVDLCTGEKIIVRLWDTIELEKDNNLPTSYIRNRDGFILVWDIKRGSTLKELIELYKVTLTFYGDEHMPAYVIFANKAEMEMRQNSEEYESCQNWSLKHNINCYKTSTTTGANLEEGLDRLVEMMTMKEPVVRRKKQSVDIDLTEVRTQSKCCN